MRNNQSGSKGGKGYYIALVLCAAAIGITSYVTRNSHKPEPEKISLMEQTPTAVPETAETQAVEALATEAPETEPSKSPSVPAKKPTQETQPKKLKTAAPLSGNVTTLYAMENLSYNETTRDWRVHNGVDYAAEAGTPVCAAADGTVYTTYEDDTLGYTVVIRHDGGYTTRYSSLDENLCVSPGDVVTLGQTIGYAGDSALVESVMGAHVHFSVSYQDQDMDPAEFFAMG